MVAPVRPVRVDLSRAKRKLAAAVPEVNREVAREWASTGRRLVPSFEAESQVRTGKMRSTISSRVTGRARQIVATIGFKRETRRPRLLRAVHQSARSDTAQSRETRS